MIEEALIQGLPLLGTAKLELSATFRSHFRAFFFFNDIFQSNINNDNTEYSAMNCGDL